MANPSLGSLHHFILLKIIERQNGPAVDEIANHFEINSELAEKLLNELANYHGAVLHPNSSKIWIIHPFALYPTNFTVKTAEKTYWATCIWCSFGIASLLDENVKIETRIGGTGRLIELNVRDDQLIENEYVAHFPVKMTDAWKNVVYTCSVMLVFENENQIDDWCERNNVIKGDVIPIDKAFSFAVEWYGNHLNPNWEKWTNNEAIEIFKKYDLTSDIWEIPSTDSRF